jgi:chromosomal replication initiator protein DnaA
VTTSLNTKYSFETFVVGAANRLAVTAGRTVAENPGSAYNPLFVYSSSGLGKTHLLMAIGHAAKRTAPNLNVEYLSLDEYVEAFHAAIAAGQGDAFRRRFQNVDLLLVDDVQLLTNRKEMQSELLRLTEALQIAGHQLVLTSDRPPPEIADLDERLISRLSGGLVVDMGVPDYETRVAILRRKAEERGASFQPGVLETVAGREFANVRELMGALNRLVAFQAVSDTPVNAAAAKQLLGGGISAARAPLTPGASPGQGASPGPGGAGPEPIAAGASPGPADADEFGAFLADVTLTVGHAVEAWRARVAEAVIRWGGEGYRTRRLELLLQQEAPAAVDDVIAEFAKDVERLKALEVEIAQLDPQAAGQSVFRDPERMGEAAAAAAKVRDGLAPPPGPSAAFPLAAYAVGPSNQVAVSAVHSVLEQPGRKYNPLVLVGKSGLGKTHLLNALGLELARADGAVVACLSTQAFVDELIAAIDGNRVNWWRARYRRATALLLDDIQLIAGKERTQEELFHLLNLFQDKERQLAFTAPGPPNTLPGIEQRVVSRLEGGLVAELKEPDRDLKRAVLERLLSQHHVTPEHALVDYLADRPSDSVRTLVGVVQRLVDAANAREVPLSAGFAREVLEGQPAREGRRAAGARASGLVVSSLGGIKSREKMVWDWPDVGERLIEEFH